MIGSSMACGNPVSGRNDDDFYQTEIAATEALMRFLRSKWYIRKCPSQPMPPFLVWDSACGKGAMSEVIKGFHFIDDVIATDLVDRGYGTGGVDFLNINPLPETSKGVYDTIIINQPFNKTFEFWDHANKIGAKCVVMLMKAQYWHSNWQKSPKTSKIMWDSWQPSWWLPLTWRPQFMDPEVISKMKKKPSPTMDVAWCVWDRYALHNGMLTVPLQKPIGM